MPTFKTEDCPVVPVNYFTSGAYTRSSFSTSWNTRTIPDTDLTDSRPVYIQVLDKFKIPVTGTGPNSGTLPGIDIQRMDARDAIKFSLAESLLDGQWWEVYEDGSGGVFFEKVFDNGSPSTTVDLTVRLCVPSASKTNEVDMVVVNGYKPPAERSLKPFKDVVPTGTGPINPTSNLANSSVFTVAEGAIFAQHCAGKLLATTVYKSYRDPNKDGIAFGSQVTSPFYDPAAFESIIGFVQQLSGVPDDNSVSFEFQKTTSVYIPITIPAFQKVSVPSCAQGLPQHSSITYYESKFTYNAGTFKDRYGFDWPLALRPKGLIGVQYTIDSISEVTAANLAGSTQSVTTVFVNPTAQIAKLTEANGFTWQANNNGSSFDMTFYYQPNVAPEFWDIYLGAVGSSTTLRFRNITEPNNPNGAGATSQTGGMLLPAGQNGSLLQNVHLVLEIDRPSVMITDKSGDALSFASSLRVQSAPIVVTDTPAPIAYFHKTAGGKIVDQSQNIQDSDPTTCQNFQITDLAKMNDLQTGNSVTVSLPFVETGSGALTVAKTLYDYMSHEDVSTFVVTCSPGDNPILGAAVSGFPADLRITSISYNYSDSSSYTISVTLGPVFTSIGGWNDQKWIRKVETVSRQGIVTWSAGDGTNYRVYVQGLGVYNAINTGDGIAVYRAGERVSVTIENLPQEV